MDTTFFIKLFLSFIIGGSWVITATLCADKFGTKIGGLIAGLPSTVLFGLFFIAWTQGTKIAVEATTVNPIGAGIGCVFLLSYASLIRRNIGLKPALLFSLTFWIILSILLIFIKFNNFSFSLLSYFFILIFSFYIFEYRFKILSFGGKKIKYTKRQIILRGILSGFIVAFSVFLGKIGGPIFGGIFTVFPAMFTSTLIITYLSQGSKFSLGITKSLMVSGISVVIYSLCVRFTYIPFGLIFGTLISVIISFGSGFFIYKIAIKKLS